MSNDRVKVEIDDMNFYVVGNDDKEYVKGLAEMLDEQLNKVHTRNYQLNQVEGLVLAALNILDEKETIKINQSKAASLSEDQQAYYDAIEHVKKLENDAEELTRNLEAKNQTIDTLKEENTKLKDNIRDLNKKYDELNAQLDTQKTVNENLEKQLESTQEKNYDSQLKIADLNKEISILRGED